MAKCTPQEKIESARTAIKLLLSHQKGILLKHRRELLKVLISKITEADGKYNTQYVSVEAKKIQLNERKGRCHHEHVFRKDDLVDMLLKAWREKKNVDNIIKNKFIACVVTKEEHKRLPHVPGENGWVRYKKGKVIDFDTRKTPSRKVNFRKPRR